MKHLYLIVFVFMLAACHSTKEVVKDETIQTKYIVKKETDTIMVHTRDSIYHNVFVKGDTVFDTKVIEKTRYKDRVVLKCDTVANDSVVIKTKTKEVVVEKKDKKAWLFFIISFIFNIFAIIKIVKRWTV